MKRFKGTLQLSKAALFTVGMQVVEYFPQLGTAKLFILFNNTEKGIWESRCGETLREEDLYKFYVKEDITNVTTNLKNKQWLSCLQGKTKVGEEVEYEIVVQDDFKYARILPKTTHYTEQNILDAYELGISDSAKLIKRSITQVKNYFKTT